MAENSFVGHVISLDGNDYIHANKNNPGDSWDVAYVEYTVNEDYVWDASKETPLPVVEIDLSKKLTEVTDQMVYITDPLRDAIGIEDPNAGTGEPDITEPTEPGENEEDEESTKDPQGGAAEGNWIAENWWIIAVAAAAVVIVVVVVVIVAGGKKKN